MLNLNLSQKGLLLIGVLLAIELIFVSTLTTLLNQAEYEIWKEAHAKTVIAKADETLNVIQGGIVALVSYRMSRNPAAAARIDAIIGQAPEEVHSLELLLKDYSGDKSDLRGVIATTDRAVDLIKSYKSFIDEGEQAVFRESEILAEIDRSFEQLTQGLQSVTKIEREIAAQPPASEARSRLLVKYALLSGVAINIVLAVILGLSFTKGIVKRLSIMIDNTQQLAAGKPLNEPLTGSDEITRLDRTFHEMADGLKEVDRWKREFFAMVTHDLRSPLSAISGALALMIKGVHGELSDKNLETCRRAQRGAARLLALANDLLDIEKMEAGKWELVLDTVSAQELFQQSIESIQTLAQQSNVNVESQHNQIELFADKKRLVQVIVNLLSNAIKFSPGNSTVTLTATETPGWIEITVSDQGRGIPKSDLDKVFNRFEQLKATDAIVKGGSGLGLAVCRGIIEEHKGKIGVDSEEGKGSTFWVRVPALGGALQKH
jgi:signal transduction histidine kinase